MTSNHVITSLNRFLPLHDPQSHSASPCSAYRHRVPNRGLHRPNGLGSSMFKPTMFGLSQKIDGLDSSSLLTLGIANGQLFVCKSKSDPKESETQQLGTIGNWASQLGVGFSNFATSAAVDFEVKARSSPWLLWIPHG